MREQKVRPEDVMMRFILSKWISRPVYVAARLGLADILLKKSAGAAELAEATGTHPEALYRLMRALAGLGIFEENGKGEFINTPLSECLAEGRLRPAALMFHSEWHDRLWSNLGYSVREGKPAFEEVFGVKAFEWFERNPEEARIFNEANSIKAGSVHRQIADSFDFSDISELTDVGGGLGGLMIEILRANPGIKGVIAELPRVVAELEALIGETGLGERLKAVECDFFKEVPQGSDAYILSNILHDWPDGECSVILENCRRAAGREGRLLVVEYIIPPGNSFSVAKLMDLEMLLMGGGRERTQKEFEQLLASHGFAIKDIKESPGGVSLIEAIAV